MNAEQNAVSKPRSLKVDEILAKLDAASCKAAVPDRKQKRYSYRLSNTQATFEHPGGGVAQTIVNTRALWAEGMSLLCRSFFYLGSTFKTTLKSKDGESMSVLGSVVGCQHIEGIFHEIEVKFNQRLDPHLFIDEAPGSNGESSRPTDLFHLRGRVLHLDDSEADARLLMHYLRGSGIEIKSVRKSEEALQALRTGAFDIFLCDLNLGGGEDGTPVVRTARSDGFTGPIVAMSAETNIAKLAAMKAAGADHALSKPYLRDALEKIMVKVHHEIGAISDGEIIYSSLSDEPDTAEMISSYVASAQKIAQDMQKPIADRDFNRVREYCMTIHGSASGYGFVPLGVAAEEAIRALDSTMSVDEARRPLRRLTLLCAQLGIKKKQGLDVKSAQDHAPKTAMA